MKDFINELDDYNRNHLKTKVSSTKCSLKIPVKTYMFWREDKN